MKLKILHVIYDKIIYKKKMFWRKILMDEKTNVMRILDKKKIKYNHYCYTNTDAISGLDVATVLNQYYVFVIPVEKELNLKKAAKCVGEKSIEMIKSKELLPITGYIHGGCSPIGMKKNFTTTINKSAEDFDTIIFSGGKIGYQVEVSLEDLSKVIRFQLEEVV